MCITWVDRGEIFLAGRGEDKGVNLKFLSKGVEGKIRIYPDFLAAFGDLIK